MSTELNLLPCAHCGSADVHFSSPGSPDEQSYDFVICNGCGVSAGRADCLGDLIETWNRRASPAAAVPEGALPPLPTEKLLRLIAENTGRRINLSLDDLDQYLSVARAAVEADRARQQDMSVRLAGAPASQQEANARDAARYRWLCNNNYDRTGRTQIHTILHWSEFSKCGGVVEWQQRMRGGALDRIIDEEMTKGAQS